MSKVITIIGNSNSGKTTMSYFLANKLAYDGKKVMLVVTNNQQPDFQYLLKDEKKGTRSLGRVLSLALINQKDILDNMCSLDNKDIGLLCYALSETKNTYPKITQSNIATLFDVLKLTVDYIIVDTQSYRNSIDTYALSISDFKICLSTANVKGLAFRNCLEGVETDYINILYSDSPYNPYEDIKGSFAHRVQYELPFCKSLQTIYNGDTLCDVDCGKKYSTIMEKLAREVIEVE